MDFKIFLFILKYVITRMGKVYIWSLINLWYIGFSSIALEIESFKSSFIKSEPTKWANEIKH